MFTYMTSFQSIYDLILQNVIESWILKSPKSTSVRATVSALRSLLK